MPDPLRCLTKRAGRSSAFEAHFVVLISAMILLVIIISMSNVLTFLHNREVTSYKVESPLRALRELLYAVLLLSFFLHIISSKAQMRISTAAGLAWLGVCLYVCFELIYSASIGLPALMLVSGVRFFEYIPLVYISYYVFKTFGENSYSLVARSALVLLVFESAVAAIETRLPIYVFGDKTFLGARAFGTFPSPDIFGPVMVALYILIASTMGRPWRAFALLLTLFDAFASGSRAGILGCLGVVAVLALGRLRSRVLKLFSYLVALAVSPLLLVLFTLPQFTGRATGVNGGGYERFQVWANVLKQVKNGYDLLIGWGTGLGSNTAFAIFGSHGPHGMYISDNTLLFLLGSYGLLGVLACLFVICLLIWYLRSDPIGLATCLIFILELLVAQVMELYPVNVLCMLLFGWRMAAQRPVRYNTTSPLRLSRSASFAGELKCGR